MASPFNPVWRHLKSAAFSLEENSTAGHTLRFPLWGREVEVYANANLSLYSAQPCNARCAFCVEELRPASRGTTLTVQKRVESDDGRYFARLEETLRALKPLNPSVSMTGGEVSLDPRLPHMLRLVKRYEGRKRTLTTNGSGLLRIQDGQDILQHILEGGLAHLNISVAHPDPERSARLMRLPTVLTEAALREITQRTQAGGTRLRLSCVLLQEGVRGLEEIRQYLAFAERLGVDNVIFRQLMQVDMNTVEENFVTRYSARQRVMLEPLLNTLDETPGFERVRQVMGYYYYVEVWRVNGMDVVFEEADLARLEESKRLHPERIHELIFHPNGMLCSTWQPWDGVLGPPEVA